MKTLLILALALVYPFTATAAPLNPTFVEQGNRVRAIAATLPFPADWRFVVVNDVQFQDIIQGNGLTLNAHSAISSLKAHVTFIRVTYLLQNSDATVRPILAHELGHVRCGCRDEAVANQWRDKILAQSGR